jgi:hypothetical protein
MHQKCRLLPRERFAALPGAIWGVSLQIFLVVGGGWGRGCGVLSPGRRHARYRCLLRLLEMEKIEIYTLVILIRTGFRVRSASEEFSAIIHVRHMSRLKPSKCVTDCSHVLYASVPRAQLLTN